MIGCPTVDEAARAIVAGCQETGDDPIRCALQIAGSRGRHYALHALAHFYPPETREEKELLARLVGCPGKALMFWNNSNSAVFRLFPWPNKLPDRKRVHWAAWFDDDAFERVKAAVRPLPVTTVAPTVPARRIITTRPEGYRPTQSELMGDPPPGRSALDQRRELHVVQP